MMTIINHIQKDRKTFLLKDVIATLSIFLFSLSAALFRSGDPISIRFQVFLYGISFLCLCAYIWRTVLFRWISIILLFMFAFSVAVNAFSFVYYKTEPNVGLISAVINTDYNEAAGMLSYYRLPALCSLLMIVGLHINTHFISKHVSTKKLFFLSLAFPLFVAATYTKNSYSSLINLHGYSPFARTLEKTPFNVFSILIQLGNKDHEVVTNSFQLQNTSIDTYVIVLGESQRKNHLGLYGYNRQTTPQLNKDKENMLLFQNAIAPGPTTEIAVPLSLSSAAPDNYQNKSFHDNVINLANQAGFKTYWLSMQGVGKYYSPVSQIANDSSVVDDSQKGQFDEKVFDLFVPILKEKKKNKKLIVLHLYGSHEPPCARYPINWNIFKGSPIKDDDCYDNSITYTDSILGKIFDLLRTVNASVLYFSDHALERNPAKKEIYYHAIGKLTQEALSVPQFIWYSANIDPVDKKLGTIAYYYPTYENYYLIANWLGIQLKNEACLSVLESCYKPKKDVWVVDASSRLYKYASLFSESYQE